MIRLAKGPDCLPEIPARIQEKGPQLLEPIGHLSNRLGSHPDISQPAIFVKPPMGADQSLSRFIQGSGISHRICETVERGLQLGCVIAGRSRAIDEPLRGLSSLLKVIEQFSHPGMYALLPPPQPFQPVLAQPRRLWRSVGICICPGMYGCRRKRRQYDRSNCHSRHRTAQNSSGLGHGNLLSSVLAHILPEQSNPVVTYL
jgi:hypothetical protein